MRFVPWPEGDESLLPPVVTGPPPPDFEMPVDPTAPLKPIGAEYIFELGAYLWDYECAGGEEWRTGGNSGVVFCDVCQVDHSLIGPRDKNNG